MSEATTKTSATTLPKSPLASRIGFGLLVLLLSGIVIVYGVLWFGTVNGEEFSPDSFKRRRFAYIQLPLLGFQITPIRHTDETNDLEKYLSAEQLYPKAEKAQSRWDLVHGSQGVGSATQGDARILCLYLDTLNDDGDELWLKWSEDNAELAKVLWSAVAKVARDELYSFVPGLFVLARTAESPDQLQQAIDQELADKYLLTAEAFEALGEAAAAAELFAQVLHHAPDRTSEVGGRDKPVATP